MMGAGKTTVGKLLAQELQYRFFDTDQLIEQVAGKTINEIFTEDGEATFRQIESKILEELSAYTRLAIATGGGIILKRENWGSLQQGLVIWLDVPVKVLVSRLSTDDTRPLLKDTELTTKLENLLAERKNLYEQADLKISINQEDTASVIATRIMESIPSVLKTQP